MEFLDLKALGNLKLLGESLNKLPVNLLHL